MCCFKKRYNHLVDRSFRINGYCRPGLLFIVTAVMFCNAITLDSIITRSDSCIAIEWTPDSVNTNPSWYVQYGALCTGLDSIYKKCDFIPGRAYHGVAYSYGGEDPWFLFRSRLLSGFLAGSHQCHYLKYNDPSDKVTGTDCSGFLSFVWKVSRVSTSVFYSSASYTTIPISQVRAGDALVKASTTCGYHAILIIEAEDLSEVVVSEASSTALGCRERIIDLTGSAWSCYKAIRYPGLVIPDTRHDHIFKNQSVPDFFVTIAPEVIMLHVTIPFMGTISCYLPDGTLLYENEIRIPALIVPIPRGQVKSNLVIINVQQPEHHPRTLMTVLQ